MSERRKILELLQDGKISPEQAEMLLDALEGPSGGNRPRFHIPSFDKPKWDATARELKTFGTQISSILTQALSDAKKEIEHQVGDFMGHDTIFRSHDFEMQKDLNTICIETTDCKIRAIEWDHPVGRISVHGQIRRVERTESDKGIEESVSTEYANGFYRLSVIQGGMSKNVRITSIDVFLPKGIAKLQLKSRNGSLQIDSTNIGEIELQTQNGSITMAYVNAGMLRVASGNGRINLFHSIGSCTKNVYVSSKNGTIAINGIDAKVNCIGTAKTMLSQVEIDENYFDVIHVDEKQKTEASFRNKLYSVDEPATIISCETDNGKIVVRPV